MRTHKLALVGAILFGLAVPAHAQSGFFKENVTKMIRKVGVHGNLSFRNPLDSDVTKGRSEGLSIGLAPGRTNGWKYPVGISFFSQDLHAPAGPSFGTIDTKAILGGIGYGWHFGKLSTTAALQTGYAFNSGNTTGDPLAAFGYTNGLVSIDAGNSWLLRPELKAEYSITPRFTIRTSGGYVLMQPNITVLTPGGPITDRWDASNLHANIGVGFYPFNK